MVAGAAREVNTLWAWAEQHPTFSAAAGGRGGLQPGAGASQEVGRRLSGRCT